MKTLIKGLALSLVLSGSLASAMGFEFGPVIERVKQEAQGLNIQDTTVLQKQLEGKLVEALNNLPNNVLGFNLASLKDQITPELQAKIKAAIPMATNLLNKAEPFIKYPDMGLQLIKTLYGIILERTAQMPTTIEIPGSIQVLINDLMAFFTTLFDTSVPENKIIVEKIQEIFKTTQTILADLKNAPTFKDYDMRPMLATIRDMVMSIMPTIKLVIQNNKDDLLKIAQDAQKVTAADIVKLVESAKKSLGQLSTTMPISIAA